jgi:hypothetical protein
MKNTNKETHHFLPSGEWEGFYCYSNSPVQHKMRIKLNFSNATVYGSGIDDVNTFTWNGNYSLETFLIKMIKTYVSHTIIYKGDIDENGIWGIWENPNNSNQNYQDFSPELIQMFKSFMIGGFHIWPKASKNEAQEETKQEEIHESKLVQKIFVENF